MYGNNPAPPTKKWQNLTTCKVGVLLRELSDDEDQDKTSDIGDISSNPHTPWHGDFHGYLNLKDQLGAMTIVMIYPHFSPLHRTPSSSLYPSHHSWLSDHYH